VLLIYANVKFRPIPVKSLKTARDGYIQMQGYFRKDYLKVTSMTIKRKQPILKVTFRILTLKILKISFGVLSICVSFSLLRVENRFIGMSHDLESK